MYLSDEKEIDAVRRVFEKRRLFRYQLSGPSECQLFEREFSEKIGVPHSLILTSGTNALIAALTACEVGPGDEVIIPCYTFVATALAVMAVGARPVVANIDETLGISTEDVERRITPRTKAVIPVHMDGLASDLRSICRLARERKLFVIEDAAQAIGGSYQGKRLGTWGDFGCFSLNENKNITCGEGGILVTRRRHYYERAFCMHDGSAQFNPANRDLFEVTRPSFGVSMRVSEISAAIMRVQLQRLDEILCGLRDRKKLYVQRLRELPGMRLILGNCEQGDCCSSVHLRFEDPGRAMVVGQALRSAGYLFAPATTRPAHASWKWAHLLASEGYSSAEYLESLNILSGTLKTDIDFNMSISETERSVEAIRRILDHV